MSAPPAQSGSILVVDDDATFRGALARSLMSRGYEVWTAANYFEAVGRVLAEPPQFAVVDLKMAGRSGFDLVEEIKRVHPATTIVVLTADRSPESKAEAVRRGASVYLTKPTDADEVIAAFTHDDAIARRTMARDDM